MTFGRRRGRGLRDGDLGSSGFPVLEPPDPLVAEAAVLVELTLPAWMASMSDPDALLGSWCSTCSAFSRSRLRPPA